MMITTTTRTIAGWNVEIKTYPKGFQMFRIKDKGHTTMWDGYTNDKQVETVIRAITSTNDRRIRLDI